MNNDADSPFAPLEHYRPYLHLLARLAKGSPLATKLDPSDLVQETLLKAHRHQAQFRGRTEEEWRGYLRRILANTIADAARDLAHEKIVHQEVEQSSNRLEAWLAAEQSSPSEIMQREEKLVQLAAALMQLDEDERMALEMRYFHEPRRSLADIAAHLKRPTTKAVAGLLARGLEKLRRFLRDEP